MNNPPAFTNVGYYPGTSGYGKPATLKCKFCKSLLLPTMNSHSLQISSAASWLCLGCPNPVFYTSNADDYHIMVSHNDHWYEIRYLPISKQHLIFRWENQLVIQPENGSENYSTSHVLVKQIECERNITPSNAKDKLLTILTFS